MMEERIPKVSVVIAVYNAEMYLRQCMDTVCGQTLKEIEIICVDDGSTDESTEILQEYAKKDKRICILHHMHTGMGAAGARNMGLAVAKGEYIIFWDADDYFDLELLEKSYIRAEKTNADVIMFDAQKFHSESGGFIQSKTLQTSLLPDDYVFAWAEYPTYIFQAPIGTAWALFIRRQCIIENGLEFQSIYYTDDFFFAYSILICARRVSVIREKLLYYRVNHAQSQTCNRSKSPLSPLQACEKVKMWMEERGVYAIYRKSFINRVADFCGWYLNTLLEHKAFTTLFEQLKNGGLQKLGLAEANADDFYDPYLYHWKNNILFMSCEEYLFWRMREQAGFQFNTKYSFPANLVTAEDRIVLYGAGARGRAYYIENLVRRHCRIVQWVDDDYQYWGEPVEHPEKLIHTSFDKIIIAIEDGEERERVREKLIAFGIEIGQKEVLLDEK